MHYFLVELNYFSGGTGRFIFLQEENAKRCLAHYAANAEKQAKALGNSATATVKPDSVSFEWDGPIGIVRWSAKLTRLGSDDLCWQV